MHIEHKAGEAMFVDYPGKKLTISEEVTGRVREVEVLVAILPCQSAHLCGGHRNSKEAGLDKSQ